jgi:hypothetical protein
LPNEYIIHNGELYHWGIKGQKWGIRRYQNKDGSLTPAGKKRYGDDSDSPKQKTTHREKLEAKYRQNGMSEAQAKAAASKQIHIEKAVAVTAGMTLAAATAYAANKYNKEYADKVIKSGMTLQRVTGTPDESVDRAFYAAYKKGDLTKYKGLYGAHLGVGQAHKVTLNLNSDVKVASRDKAAKAFMDLYKNDPEFQNQFRATTNKLLLQNQMAGIHDKSTEMLKTAHKTGLTDKQLKKFGYDAFNMGLVDHSTGGQAASKKFYDKLKQMGYDAIVDINDRKYSGYGAKAPVIVFNNAGKISIAEAKKMTGQQIRSNANKARADMARKSAIKEGTAIVGAITAGSYASITMNKIAVDNYKIEHPNTTKTDQQILETLGRI